MSISVECGKTIEYAICEWGWQCYKEWAWSFPWSPNFSTHLLSSHPIQHFNQQPTKPWLWVCWHYPTIVTQHFVEQNRKSYTEKGHPKALVCNCGCKQPYRVSLPTLSQSLCTGMGNLTGIGGGRGGMHGHSRGSESMLLSFKYWLSDCHYRIEGSWYSIGWRSAGGW